MIRDRGLRLLHLWRIGDFYEAQKGDRFRSEWTSLRFSPFTRGWDGVDHYHPMVRPFPFPSGSFDAVYARRLVEHLVLAEADQFMSELHRLCVPGAVVRLCVPDFEEMCRSYLLATENAWETDDPADLRRQELLVIECVVQMVRERSGGFLGPAIRSGRYDSAFIRERYGDVFETVLSKKNWPTRRGRRWSIARILGGLRRRAWNLARGPDPRRERENNRWMYDRVNARMLCERNGFTSVQMMPARESRIPDWSRYEFDWSEAGRHEVEPSLYIECQKPTEE